MDIFIHNLQALNKQTTGLHLMHFYIFSNKNYYFPQNMGYFNQVATLYFLFIPSNYILFWTSAEQTIL